MMRSGLFASSLAALCALGCDYGDSSTPPGLVYVPTEPGVSAFIDTDAELTNISPGVETGLFVEYQSGGLWRLYMTCDVSSGFACDWDVIAAPSDGIVLDAIADGTELDDDVLLVDRDFTQVQILAFTDTDFDGMFVETNPGTGLIVDVLLDGGLAPDYVFWVSDGAANYGAPANPIELVPTSP